jgi:hypothetical protein
MVSVVQWQYAALESSDSGSIPDRDRDIRGYSVMVAHTARTGIIAVRLRVTP